MSVKDFFMSYLSPFFLLYRVSMIMYGGMLLIIGNGVVADKAGLSGWGIDVYIYGLVMSLVLFKFLRHRVWWLYLWIPLLLSAFALETASSNPTISMTMVSCSGFLFFINAFRFWGYGVSLNDINHTLQKYTKR